MTTTARRPLGRNTATLLAASVALLVLWSTDVPTPRWRALADAAVVSPTDLVDALAHGARVLATGLLVYLVLATSLNLLAALCATRGRAPGFSRLAGRFAPRWLAVATIGVVASSGVFVPASGASGREDGGPRRDDVLLEVISDAGTPDGEAPRTMLPWAVSPATAPSTTAPSAPPTTLPDPPRLMPLEPGQLPPPLVIEREASVEVRAHTVLPGEHFWGIAEQVVAERGLTVEVTDYWRLLIEANRSRLVDPDDPDLIHPGQVLVLP